MFKKKLNEIRERKAELALEIEKPDADFEKISAEISELAKRNKKLEELQGEYETINGDSSADDPKGEPVAKRSFASAATNESQEMAYRKAYMDYMVRGKPVPERLLDAEYSKRAMTYKADIGILVPNTIINTIIEPETEYGEIFSRVTKMHVNGTVQLPVGGNKPTASWSAEGADIPTQNKTNGTPISLGLHQLVVAFEQTLQTSVTAMPVFEANIARNMRETMILTIENAILYGDGTLKPKGILYGSIPANKTVTLAAGGPTYKNIVDANAKVPSPYNRTAVWVMNSQTFSKFEGMTDASGQPIARVDSGISEKMGPRLNGRPVIFADEYMPILGDSETAAGTVVAAIVRLRDYYMNINLDMLTRKYVENKNLNTVSQMIMLLDGVLADSKSLVAVKTASS
ncbi:hypothetical protein FACS1894188_03800 [Clostridia bacterium]|nr:hypothetical protein FACS1894188_03800 [Clostridia bacterium]